MPMKLALKATMLVIGILFLAVAIYMYGHVAAVVKLTEAAALPRAIGAAGGFVGSAVLAGLCLLAYVILRREPADEASKDA